MQPRNLSLYMLAALIVLAASVAVPSPAAAGEHPAPAARFVFVIHASANGTANNTTSNKTAGPCTPAANDYCFRQIYILSTELAAFIQNANSVINILVYGFVTLVAIVIIQGILLVRYVRDKAKQMHDHIKGPDDPRNYDLAIPIIARAVADDPRSRKAFEDAAKKVASKDLAARLKNPPSKLDT